MDIEAYLQEIEALVLHLSPQAHLLGDMDLHVIEELYDRGIPLHNALAGIRKGAHRLSRLKRPPRGLPLARVRRDVEKEAGLTGKNKGGVEKPSQEPPVAPPPVPESPWRTVLQGIADAVDGEHRRALTALAADEELEEERAFVRYLGISRTYYQEQAERLAESSRAQLEDEVSTASAAVLTGMDPLEAAALLDELVRRRLIAQDPVLDPQRFWQE